MRSGKLIAGTQETKGGKSSLQGQRPMQKKAWTMKALVCLLSA